MSLDGTWKVTVDSPMGKEESTLELRMQADALQGSQSGAQGSGSIKDARVEDDDVSWSASITMPFPMTLEV
jgi:hypothetical protein